MITVIMMVQTRIFHQYSECHIIGDREWHGGHRDAPVTVAVAASLSAAPGRGPAGGRAGPPRLRLRSSSAAPVCGTDRTLGYIHTVNNI
jgi:hypothetical protein